MKNFAIIIFFKEKQCIKVKTKTRTRASSRFEAVCCNLLSAAIDCWEVLGVAVRRMKKFTEKVLFCIIL